MVVGTRTAQEKRAVEAEQARVQALQDAKKRQAIAAAKGIGKGGPTVAPLAGDRKIPLWELNFALHKEIPNMSSDCPSIRMDRCWRASPSDIGSKVLNAHPCRLNLMVFKAGHQRRTPPVRREFQAGNLRNIVLGLSPCCQAFKTTREPHQTKPSEIIWNQIEFKLNIYRKYVWPELGLEDVPCPRSCGFRVACLVSMLPRSNTHWHPIRPHNLASFDIAILNPCVKLCTAPGAAGRSGQRAERLPIDDPSVLPTCFSEGFARRHAPLRVHQGHDACRDGDLWFRCNPMRDGEVCQAFFGVYAFPAPCSLVPKAQWHARVAQHPDHERFHLGCVPAIC